MEIFINELSLHGQYNSVAEFEQAVIQFNRLFSFINEQVKNKFLFKDVFINRQAVVNSPFSANFEQLRDKSLKDAFRNIVFNRSNPRNWRETQVHHPDDFYVCQQSLEENDGLVTDTSLAEAAARKIENDTIEKLLLNFKSSRFGSSKAQLTIVKNNEASVDLLHFDQHDDFETWFASIPVPLDIFIRNEARFRRTKFIVQGATVFEEIETGCFWYLDKFHKNEFEVFDHEKNHIFVADLEGKLIPNSQKAGRRF